MNSKRLFSIITLATVLSTGLVLPTAASAHEVVREKHVKVIRDVDHRDRHQHRHSDKDHWYVQRHRKVKSRWAPHGHHHKHNKKHCKKCGHSHTRHESHVRREYREYRDYRPAEYHREYPSRSNDSLRIRIGYDIVL